MIAERAVQVSGLSKMFGTNQVLDDVAFTLNRGSTVALLGPSGCGKTTILRCLAGLERPDAGRICIGDHVVFDAMRRVNVLPERRQLGVVFQSYAVWPHMTVAENVAFPLRVRKLPRVETARRVAEMLDLVGLGSAGSKMVGQLSGGQQQRVAIARALIGEPELVLFDEALSNLDAQLRDQVRMELQLLQKTIGFTALYVTHDQTEAFALAEQVIVMNGGRVETAGAAAAVFERPSSLFVARFLGLNVLAARVDTSSRAGAGLVEAEVGGATVRGLSMPSTGAASVCVRREQVAILPAGSPGPIDCNLLPGELVAVAYLGLNREYLIRVGAMEMKVIAPAAPIEVGQVLLAFKPRDTFVFHA